MLIGLKIKGEKVLHIPSPKNALIIATDNTSSKPSLNFKPFSLIAFPEIIAIKQRSVDKITVKIRLSIKISFVELPKKIKPSNPTKL